MKHIFNLLLALCTLSVMGQYPISKIEITMPAQPSANTADWASGTEPFIIDAKANLVKGKVPGDVIESCILVIIKSGGSKICGSFTGQTAPGSKFTTATKTWSGAEALGLLGKTCLLKPGSYELCVQFFSAGVNFKPLSAEACKTFTIADTKQVAYSPPKNIMPADGKKFTEQETKQPIIFKWTPVLPKPKEDVMYIVRVYAVEKGQAPSQAIKVNKPIFKKEINSTQTIWQMPGEYATAKENKTFVWNVQAVGTERTQKGVSMNYETSEPFILNFAQNDIDIDIDSLRVGCCNNGQRVINFTIKNNLANTDTKLEKVWITSVNGSSGAPYPLNISGVVSPSLSSILPSSLVGGGRKNFTAMIDCIDGIKTLELKVEAKRIIGSTSVTDQDIESYTLDCGCCDGFTRRVENLHVLFGSTEDTKRDLFQLSGSLSAGPRLIKKVSAELIYLSIQSTNPECLKCIPNSLNFGNIKSGTLTGFGMGINVGQVTSPSGAPQYGREIIWKSSLIAVNMAFPKPFNLLLVMPPAPKLLSCCSDTMRFCIRFSFTDTNCVTCDTLICLKVIHDSTGIRLAIARKNVNNSWYGIMRDLRNNENGLITEETNDYTASSFNLPTGNDNSRSGNTFFLFTLFPVLISGRKIKYIIKNQSSLISGRFRKFFQRLGLLIILILQFSSARAQTNVTVTITSDNAYVFGFGNVNGITDYRSPGVCNLMSAEIYSYASGTETYPITANIGGYIYIIAWSDEQAYQGLIAQFSDGNTTILTSPNLPNPSAKWEVFATGIPLNPLTTDTTLPRGNLIYPTLTQINDQISIANTQNGDPATTSIGWVQTTVDPNRNGVLVFGPSNLGAGTSFPPQTVNGILPAAQWMWYNPQPLSITNTFKTGDLPDFPDSLSREYYIFRVGPIDSLFPSQGCCSNFNISFDKYTIIKEKTIPGLYSFTTQFSAGPNKIKKVTASLVHFSMTHSNPDCEQCVKPVRSFGSFIGADPLSTTPPFTAVLTDPYNISPSMTSIREIVWSDPNGSSVFLTNVDVKLRFMVPEESPLYCCSDTMRLCIRYKFTDTGCITCDTLVCYTFIQKGKSSSPDDPDTPPGDEMKKVPIDIKNKDGIIKQNKQF